MPVAIDGATLGDARRDRPTLNDVVGSYGWGRIDMVENRRVGIKSRETYECPASLALILAHNDLESICLERDLDREKARLEPRYAELDLRRPLVLAAQAGARRVRRRRASSSSPARCGCTSSRVSAWSPAGAATTASTTTAWPPTTRPTRFRHEDSAGFVRLWGLGIETWAARQGPSAGSPVTARRATRPTTTLVARPVRRRAGRRAAGLHGQPAVRPAARARRHRRVARPRARARAGRAARRRRSRRASSRALDRVEERAGATGRSRSRRPTRTSTPRSSAGSPSWPAPAGAKLHTGRSRNDQVATDLRLYAKRDARRGRRAGSSRCSRSCSTGPSEAGDAYLPGYTHLQRAQPVLLAHHLLAHGWALARDVDRLLDARAALDVSPLGAGALAGSSLPLDPDGVAADLGFAARVRELPRRGERPRLRGRGAVRPRPARRAPVAASARRSCCGRPRSSASCSLADAYATGSSMLPQKKNPDIAELARGKAGRLIGHLTGLLATLKGLPLAYNRDLQEDKEPLFDAVDQVRLALAAHGRAAGDADVRHRAHGGGGRLARRPRPPTWPSGWSSGACRSATPTRSSAASCATSLERGAPLADLVAPHPERSDRTRRRCSSPGVSVTRRTTRGGAGPAPVADAARALPRPPRRR